MAPSWRRPLSPRHYFTATEDADDDGESGRALRRNEQRAGAAKGLRRGRSQFLATPAVCCSSSETSRQPGGFGRECQGRGQGIYVRCRKLGYFLVVCIFFRDFLVACVTFFSSSVMSASSSATTLNPSDFAFFSRYLMVL